MQIEVREDSGVVFIEPVGDIDGKTAPEMLDAVTNLVKPKARVVLNMGRIGYHVERWIALDAAAPRHPLLSCAERHSRFRYRLRVGQIACIYCRGALSVPDDSDPQGLRCPREYPNGNMDRC